MLLVLVVSLFAPMTSQAAPTTHRVEIWNGHFMPYRIQAAPGDTILFENKGSAGRRIESYNSTETVDSGQTTPIAAYGTWSYTYGGAEISYRDSGTGPYSTLNGTTCSGACGYITTLAPEFPPSVTVDSPTNASPSASNIVTFSGTAPNSSTVRVTTGNVTYRDVAVPSSGAWQTQFNVANGTHTYSARAWNSGTGWASASTPVTFTVAAGDVAAPTIKLDPVGRLQLVGMNTPAKVGQIEVGAGAIEISAVVEDDSSVASVTASVTNIATEVRTDVVLSCRNQAGGEFLTGCGATSGPYVRAIAKHLAGAGYWKVEIVATDATGKVTSRSAEVIIVSPV